MSRFLIIICIYCAFASCDSTNNSKFDYSSFVLEEGVEIELVAIEPTIEAPVDIIWDSRGRMYTIEMPGYMSSVDGTDEDAPIGKLRRLIDDNADGFYEHSDILLDSLSLLRAALFCYDGLLYAEPPYLFFSTMEEDQLLEPTVVDSAYAVGGNVEHQANGLLYNIDGWIYSAKSNKRYRRMKGQWEMDYTGFRGQWGLTNDAFGRLYYNDNSNPLRADLALPGVLNFNPKYDARKGYQRVVLEDRSVQALQATAVNRGYLPDVLDEQGFLNNFTSACGPCIGGSSPKAEFSYAYICGPEVNLVKKVRFKADELFSQAQNIYDSTEFIRSWDEAFRPVNIKEGPDGHLYIVDMHKGIIQHKTYMTDYLKKQYEARGLLDVHEMGRIIRVGKRNDEWKELGEMKNLNADYYSWLKNGNRWEKNVAQQFFFETGGDPVEWRKIARESDKEDVKIRCLYLLERAGIDFWKDISFDKRYPILMSHFLVLSRRNLLSVDTEWIKSAVEAKINFLDYHLLFYLAGQDDAEMTPYTMTILERHEAKIEYFKEPLFAGMAGNEKHISSLFGPRPDLKSEIEKIKKSEKVIKRASHMDNLTKGLVLYQQHCSTCHGANGEGRGSLAPELMGSEYVSGDKDRLVNIMLYGLHGPIPLKGEIYDSGVAMPGIGGDESISDEMIKDIANYIRNAFTTSAQDVREERVTALRNTDRPKDKMFTADEWND